MNPAKDKRRRLFEAFNNKENINNYNLTRDKSVSQKRSSIAPSLQNSASPSSEIYQDELFKLQTQLGHSKQQNSNHQKRIEYHEKMQCFYLSELASFRQRQERNRKRMEILLQELPSHKSRPTKQHSCRNCYHLQKQNLQLRKQLSLKDRVIYTLEEDLEYKSIQNQVMKRHQQSQWRQTQKTEYETASLLTRFSQF